MNNAVAFEIIRNAMDDRAFFDRVHTDLDAVLTEHGFSEPRDRAEVRRVMTALLPVEPENGNDAAFAKPGGVAPTAAQSDKVGSILDELQQATTRTANAFKDGLTNTVKQIDSGFQATMMMYKVAFYLGVALIVAAVAMAFLKQNALLPIVFGGLGVADVLAYFITRPPQDLQFSRARLAQLQAAFYNWFMNYGNWNGLLAMLAQNEKVNVAQMKIVSDTLMEHTAKTMALIDQYFGSPRVSEKAKAGK